MHRNPLDPASIIDHSTNYNDIAARVFCDTCAIKDHCSVMDTTQDLDTIEDAFMNINCLALRHSDTYSQEGEDLVLHLAETYELEDRLKESLFGCVRLSLSNLGDSFNKLSLAHEKAKSVYSAGLGERGG